jgi:hypothetical protein
MRGIEIKVTHEELSAAVQSEVLDAMLQGAFPVDEATLKPGDLVIWLNRGLWFRLVVEVVSVDLPEVCCQLPGQEPQRTVPTHLADLAAASNKAKEIMGHYLGQGPINN